MDEVISVNPKVMHGAACFAGTRVPIQTLFDHLEAGYTIEGFIEQFPTVDRDQVVKLLDTLRRDVERLAAASP